MNIHWVCSRPIDVHPVVYCVIAFYIVPTNRQSWSVVYFDLTAIILRFVFAFKYIQNTMLFFSALWPLTKWRLKQGISSCICMLWICGEGIEDNIEQIMIRRLEALSRTCQLWLLNANPFSIWMRRSEQSAEYKVSNSSTHRPTRGLLHWNIGLRRGE